MYSNTYEKSQSKFINKTLLYMTMGLLVSFLSGYVIASIPAIYTVINRSAGSILVLGILEIGLVALISRRIDRLSQQAAMGFFILYSALNGVTLGSIFIRYNLKSVISVFLVAAAMFFCCSMIGMTVKKDLRVVGRIAIMGLVGIIITTLINMFIGSQQTWSMLNYLGVIVFCALTAYDMQKVKHIHKESYGMDPIMLNKFAIIAALQLYLDFINIFIYLIRIFGQED